MTLAQIRDLLFSPTTFSYCKQRCRLLYDLGYLRKRVVQQNDPDIYYLGLQGRKQIASQRAWSRADVDRIAGVSGGSARIPMLMMRHELTVSRLYVNACLESRRNGWEMSWKNARMLEGEELGIEPDAWLNLSRSGHCREAFIEFTAAMPSAAELKGKLERYQAHWERTHAASAVLWFTISRRKANALLEGIRRSPYRDCFLVGLIEDASAFLTAPIWRWGDATDGALHEMVSWIQPPAAPMG